MTTDPIDARYTPVKRCLATVGWLPAKVGLVASAFRMRSHRFDAVSSSPEPTSLLSGFVASGDRPWVVHMWDEPAKTFRARVDATRSPSARLAARMALWVALRLTRLLLRRADLVVCSLDPTRISDAYQLRSDQVLAVENGALVDPLDPQPAPAPTVPNTVVYTGPIQTSRIAHLLAAAQRLWSAGSPIALLLLGPKAPDHADPTIDELLLTASPNVTVRARHHRGEELRAAVDEAAVCVVPYPATFEIDTTYPIKLFEYFTASKAVVTTAVWGVRQVATAGRDCVMVAPGSIQQLADALAVVCGDTALATRLGAAAYRTACAHPWSAVNDRVIAGIDELVGRR